MLILLRADLDATELRSAVRRSKDAWQARRCSLRLRSMPMVMGWVQRGHRQAYAEPQVVKDRLSPSFRPARAITPRPKGRWRILQKLPHRCCNRPCGREPPSSPDSSRLPPDTAATSHSAQLAAQFATEPKFEPKVPRSFDRFRLMLLWRTPTPKYQAPRLFQLISPAAQSGASA